MNHFDSSKFLNVQVCSRREMSKTDKNKDTSTFGVASAYGKDAECCPGERFSFVVLLFGSFHNCILHAQDERSRLLRK